MSISPKPIFDWIQSLIAIGSVVLMVGISFGVLSYKVEAVEAKICVLQSDHDNLITLITKVQALTDACNDIKIDIKDIKNDLKTLSALTK